MGRFQNYLFAFILVALILLMGSPAYSFNTYRVGDVISGQEYNDVWERWFKKDLSLSVGIDEYDTEYLFFEAEAGILGPVTFSAKYNQTLQKYFIGMVSKALNWATIAKTHRADTSKSLGCLDEGYPGKCLSVSIQGGIHLSFYSSGGGQHTNLIIDIIDRKDKINKVSLYLNPNEMKKLLGALNDIDVGFMKARETVSKQDLFK